MVNGSGAPVNDYVGENPAKLFFSFVTSKTLFAPSENPYPSPRHPKRNKRP